MRRLAVILPGILLACAIHAATAQDAGSLLKVSPPQDRRVGDAKNHGGGADMTNAAKPAPAPAPEPAQAGGGKDSDAGDDIVSKPFPLSRYARLWENSPFQMESIAPPEQSEGLAQRFVLGGILRENGEPVVWIRERATQESFKVSRNATNNLGLSLVEIAESREKQSDATATIRLGNEQGVIKFDVAASPAMPGMGMGVPAPARPGIPYPAHTPPQAGARVPMPGQPTSPTVIPGQHVPGQAPTPQQPGMPGNNAAGVRPGVVPPVPGPGIPQGGQVQQAPGGPGQVPPPRVIRRRAIVPAAPIMP